MADSYPLDCKRLDCKGFTLLELLVVLAIVGIMAGTAIFLAAPSATEEGRRLGAKTYELMQKGRVNSMLKRRVYGIEILEDNTAVRLVSLISSKAPVDYNLSSESDEFGTDDFDDFNDDSVGETGIDLGEDEENKPKQTYATHKMKAEQLGLLLTESASTWELEDDKDVVEIPVKVNVGFAGSEPDPLNNQPVDADEDDSEYLEDEIVPIVMFFPDGRLSNRGSFRFMNDKGEVIYSFTWTELGKFERVN